MCTIRCRCRNRGTVLLWVMLLLLALIGFVGLALDWGYVVWTGQKLQNAADAAALAGAQKIRDGADDVNNAAILLAAANEAGGASVALDRNDDANAEDGEIVLGVYDREERTFTPTLSGPNAVRVHARRTDAAHGGAPLFFGPIFGKDAANVSRFAIAMSMAGPANNSVIALDDNDRRSFYLHGTPILDLGSGAVQVNSNHSTTAGLLQGTTAQLIAGSVNLVGAFDTNGNPTVDFTVNENVDFVPDPLATLQTPSNGPTGSRNGVAVNKIAGTGTYTAGYYSQGLDLNNTEHATLLSGTYVLGGSNAFRVRGQARITGTEVFFYIASGTVHVNGGGDIKISPPSSGTYEGISFFQSRTNTNAANFNGNGVLGGILPDGSDGAGLFYFPNALLQVGGTANTYVEKLIAKNIEVYGTGIKKVLGGYDAEEGNNVVFLVE